MKLFTLSLKRSEAPETEYEAATAMSLVVLIGANSVPPRRSCPEAVRQRGHVSSAGSEDTVGALGVGDLGPGLEFRGRAKRLHEAIGDREVAHAAPQLHALGAAAALGVASAQLLDALSNEGHRHRQRVRCRAPVLAQWPVDVLEGGRRVKAQCGDLIGVGLR